MSPPTGSLPGEVPPPRRGAPPDSRLAADRGRWRRIATGLALAALVVILDQASKSAILQAMQARPPVRVADVFQLVLVWNRGVSFGMFNNGAAVNAVIFSILAAIIVAALLHWLWRGAAPMIVIGVGLVVGGAVGNVIDRLRLGAVVDFLDFHIGEWHWPAFNLADSAICVGVAVMLIDGLLRRREAAN
ncbi:MAG: signal peptidase II [Alphaproteobacteria bacterium]|nr:signal peptidase II [Alphaproteobacteria bacterium]